MEEGGKKAIRQGQLLQDLAAESYLSLEEIARRFSVTTQTARRDVMDMERQGKLRRLHGGAMIAAPGAIAPAELRHRRARNAEAKARIGARVAALVPDGAAIFLDTGTTCEAVARALAQRRDLRVVSYSLRIAAYLREVTDFTIAIPGGFVRPVDGGVFRDRDDGFLQGFKFDLSIVSVSGVDMTGDLGDDDLAEVETVRRAMALSERSLLAVDSSKFGHCGLVRLGTIGDVDLLVTEAPPPEPIARRAHGAGVALHLA